MQTCKKKKNLSKWRVIYYSGVERLLKLIEIYRHIIKNPTKVFVEFDKPVPKIYRKEKQAQDKAKKFLKEDKGWGQCEASICAITSQDLINKVIIIQIIQCVQVYINRSAKQNS